MKNMNTLLFVEKEFKEINTSEELKKLVKIPHPNGRALIHQIPASLFESFDDEELERYDTIFTNSEVSDLLLNIGLKYLLQEEVDLRRGDLVEFEFLNPDFGHAFVIFNGEYLEFLYYGIESQTGSVPPSFQVITEFPIEYWNDTIFTHDIVFFDITPYKAEILKNIKMDSTQFTGPHGEIIEICQDSKNDESKINSTIDTNLETKNSFIDRLLEKIMEPTPQFWLASPFSHDPKYPQNGKRLYLNSYEVLQENIEKMMKKLLESITRV